jgi:hypothetical protein
MSLKVEQVWEDMRVAGGLSNSPGSMTHFIRALNSTLDELNSAMTDDFAAVTGITGTITAETWHHNAIYAGTKAFLQRQGAWAQDPDAEAFAFFQRAIGKAISGSIHDQGALFLTKNQPAES